MTETPTPPDAEKTQPSWYVHSYDLENHLVRMMDGHIATIDSMLDIDGDETDDPEFAIVAVAHHPVGFWFTLDLQNTINFPVH